MIHITTIASVCYYTIKTYVVFSMCNMYIAYDVKCLQCPRCNLLVRLGGDGHIKLYLVQMELHATIA